MHVRKGGLSLLHDICVLKIEAKTINTYYVRRAVQRVIIKWEGGVREKNMYVRRGCQKNFLKFS